MTMGSSHLDEAGRARMVDVGHKVPQQRRARAAATVRMSAEALAAIASGTAPKGDVAASARIAGIMGAKRTAELIPLCHPLPLDHATVDVVVDQARGVVDIDVVVATTAKTGVEMEALTGASIAALTVYDMVKGLDRGVVIETIHLVEKTKTDLPTP